MFRFRLHEIVTVALLMLCIQPVGLAQTKPEIIAKDAEQWQRGPDRIGMIEALLKGLYPELAVNALTITITEQNAFRYSGNVHIYYVEVARARAASEGHPLPAIPESSNLAKSDVCESNARRFVTNAEFQISRSGALRHFSSSSDLVNNKKNADLINAVRAHPKWTSTEIAAAMKNAGVRYGPLEKQELMSNLPVRTLELFFGKFRIKDLQFVSRATDAFEGTADAPLVVMEWELAFESANGVKYHASIEPFEGKVVSLAVVD